MLQDLPQTGRSGRDNDGSQKVCNLKIYSDATIPEESYESRSFTLLFMAVVSLIPISLIASLSGPMDLQSIKMFTFLPEFWIHNIGIIVGIVVFGAMLFGLARMYMMISKGIPTKQKELGKTRWFKELVNTLFKESLVQYRLSKCDDPVASWKNRLGTRWFTHMTIVWGFLGLLISTDAEIYGLPDKRADRPDNRSNSTARNDQRTSVSLRYLQHNLEQSAEGRHIYRSHLLHRLGVPRASPACWSNRFRLGGG